MFYNINGKHAVWKKKTTCVLLVHLNYVNTLCKYFILLKFAEFLFLKKVQMLYKKYVFWMEL